MFDAAQPELLLRFAIIALPILVLILLFTLLYYQKSAQRRQEGPNAAADGGASADEAALGLLHGTPVGTASAPVHAESIFAIEERLKAAKAAGEPLAELYLTLGRARLTAGDEREGLECLRSAAGLAARSGPALVHAEARIELAEAALRSGDPTSACEHWQMARMAFLDIGDAASGDKVDKRMRSNGCPTDWVLTDF